jgi:alpha-1,6-mannosyltransferase
MTVAGEKSDFYKLCALGAALAILTLLTPIVFKAWGDNAYIALTVPARIVAFVAVRVADRAPPARALWLILAVAVALRLALLLLDPLLSSDIYRYVWDGRVQAAGINPYRYIPADPALATLRDAAIYPNINRADYAVTIYPPVAQLFFVAFTRLGENVTVMRLGFLACEAATITIIALLLRRLGQPMTRLVAYLWHPLPMWGIANSGHVDALMVALMMTGIWLALSARPLRGAIVVTIGALAKPFALLALPALWRPWDWRMPTAVVAVAALCYLPYLTVGSGVFGFLTSGYLAEEHLRTGDDIWPLEIWRLVFGKHSGDYVVYLVLAAIILSVLALTTAFRRQRSPETTLADINRLLLTFLLLLSPAYPWYFLAITPFVALRGGATVWAASIGALLLQDEVDWDFYIPLIARKTILYGAVIAAFGYSIWRSRQTSSRATSDDGTRSR